MEQKIKIQPRVRLIVTAVLLGSCFISLASQTMMVTALPVIQENLHVSLNMAQWLTTGYTLIIGIVTPLSSNMYEKFSNRHVFMGILGTFIMGTILGCFATRFWMILLARLVQACASGMLMTFEMTTMITIYPARQRGAILGLASLVISAAPALGPTISGLILQFLSWRWLFILVLPLMMVAFMIGWWKLPNYTTPRPIQIDYLSVVLSLLGSSLALGSLTVFADHPTIALGMLIVGLGIIFVFVRRQLHLKTPMLKVQIVRYPSFRWMTIVGVFAFMILLGTEQLMPIFSEKILGMGSFMSGLILLPGAICNAVTASFVGRLYDQYGPKWLITIGGFIILISSVPFVMMNKQSSIVMLTIAYCCRLIGNAFVFSPALSEAFSGLSQDENSHGTALNNTLRQVFGAVSVTLCVVIADTPASLIKGVRWGMWSTVVMAVLMMLSFGRYLHLERQRPLQN